MGYVGKRERWIRHGKTSRFHAINLVFFVQKKSIVFHHLFISRHYSIYGLYNERPLRRWKKKNGRIITERKANKWDSALVSPGFFFFSLVHDKIKDSLYTAREEYILSHKQIIYILDLESIHYIISNVCWQKMLPSCHRSIGRRDWGIIMCI
jgi:hypothetical protein